MVFTHPQVVEQSIVTCVSLWIYVSVCLSASSNHIQTSPKFMCMWLVAMARPSSGSVVLCYALPVL